MRHFLANVIWTCNLSCSYCWVEQTVRQREEQYAAPVRPVEDWIAATNRDGVELMDVAGGEPYLLPWLYDYMSACPDTRFGLSTNGLSHRRVAEFCERGRLPNLVSINVSYHPEGARSFPRYHDHFAASVNALRECGYVVQSNLVNAPGNETAAEFALGRLRDAGVHVVVSPYELMDELVEDTDVPLLCDGGITHLNIAPDGQAWPCLSTMRSPRWRETCLGNWLDGTVDVSRKPQPCYLKCVDYYVLPSQHEAGDMWQLHVRRADA